MRGAVEGRRLLVELLDDALEHLVDLGFRWLLALTNELLLGHGLHHACRLLAAHHGGAAVGPGEDEARVVGAAAHAVVAGAETAADHDRDLRHGRVGHRLYHLGAVLHDAAALGVGADHESGRILQIDDRRPLLAAELEELEVLLHRALRGDRPVVADDADWFALDLGPAADRLLIEQPLELEEVRAVDQARDHFARVVRLLVRRRHDAAQLVDVVARLFERLRRAGRQSVVPVPPGDDLARHAQSIGIVLGHPFGNARHGGVHLCTAQFLVRRDLAGCGLEQRRSGQKHLGLVAHHDDVVAEAGKIGAAGRRRAVHDGDLRDPARRHACLVGEAAAARHEDLGLVEQVGAARLDEVHDRQLVLHDDLLHPLALALAGGGDRAALDRGIRRRDDAAHAFDIADARDRAAARARAVLVVVHAIARERHQFEEGRAAVEQQRDALARHQLLSFAEALTRFVGGGLHARLGSAEFLYGGQHQLAGFFPELVAVAVDLAFDDGHRSTAQHVGRPGEMEAVERLRLVGRRQVDRAVGQGHAAVDPDLGAGDVGRRVAQQEADGSGNSLLSVPRRPSGQWPLSWSGIPLLEVAGVGVHAGRGDPAPVRHRVHARARPTPPTFVGQASS